MSRPFVVRWREALRDSDLRAPCKHVGLTVSLHMNAEGGSAWPSVDTLMRETSLGRRTVQGALRDLEQLLWVIAPRGHSKGGRPTTYEARIPETAQQMRSSTAQQMRRSAPATAQETTPNRASHDRNRAGDAPEFVRTDRSRSAPPAALRPSGAAPPSAPLEDDDNDDIVHCPLRCGVGWDIETQTVTEDEMAEYIELDHARYLPGILNHLAEHGHRATSRHCTSCERDGLDTWLVFDDGNDWTLEPVNGKAVEHLCAACLVIQGEKPGGIQGMRRAFRREAVA